MRLVNTLFSLGKGGLEQVMLDYCRALIGAGHEVHTIYQPNMPYYEQLRSMPVVHHQVINNGPWDVICALRLNSFLNTIRPDAVIAHGNRSLAMLRIGSFVRTHSCPIIGVAANFKVKRFHRVDSAFSHTRQQKQIIQDIAGLKEERIFYVPNMIALPRDAVLLPDKRYVPVIGAMGRFVKKKGFHCFLEAVAELKARGILFNVILAGDGEDGPSLKALTIKLDIQDRVTFSGWIEQKSSFYNAIDVFCLPSIHEPFGIVLLEAMSYKIPIVSTDTEGPSDFLCHNKNAIIVAKDNPIALADGLERVLSDASLASHLSTEAFMLVKERFTHRIGGELLTAAIEATINLHVA